MIEQIRRCFKHLFWADSTLVDAMAAFEPHVHECKLFMAHNIASQRAWLSRISTICGPPEALWPKWTLSECRNYCEQTREGWDIFLRSVDDSRLAEPHTYTNSEGEEFKVPLVDICQHVLDHSAYHRGQIALTAREAGQHPPSTMYIRYLRSQNAS